MLDKEKQSSNVDHETSSPKDHIPSHFLYTISFPYTILFPHQVVVLLYSKHWPTTPPRSRSKQYVFHLKCIDRFRNEGGKVFFGRVGRVFFLCTGCGEYRIYIMLCVGTREYRLFDLARTSQVLAGWGGVKS